MQRPLGILALQQPQRCYLLFKLGAQHVAMSALSSSAFTSRLYGVSGKQQGCTANAFMQTALHFLPFVQELNQKVEEALACPCLDDLKDGPCGPSFVAAFSCFLKSTASEKVQ